MRTSIVLLLLLLLVLVQGCEKKSEEDPAPAPPPPPAQEEMLRLVFGFKNGQSGFSSFNDLVYDQQNRLAEITTMRFLVSNIRILENDGTIKKTFPGKVLKVDIGSVPNYAYEVGLMVHGVIPRLAFDIGLDEATNGLQPSDFSSPPLNDQTIFHGPGQGYRFFDLGGRWDSNNNGTVNTSDQAISFIALGQPMVRSIDLYMSITTLQPYVQVQMSGILNGINCSTSAVSVGSNSTNVQLMNNLQAAIHYQ